MVSSPPADCLPPMIGSVLKVVHGTLEKLAVLTKLFPEHYRREGIT